VIVSESFDAGTAMKVRDAVRAENAVTHAAATHQDELGLRLFEMPAFRAFSEQIGAEMAAAMSAPK